MSEEVVKGEEVTIRFKGERCIHSRHCVLDRPDVFVPNVKGDWIHPERATPAEALELAHNCPSGAIQCETPAGAPMESAPPVNVVRVRENGPLAFRAAMEMSTGERDFRLTLCRCGASSNKPYCDGSHTNAAFSATGEVAEVASKPLAERAGALRIEPTANGPLHVVGNLEVVTGTGKTVNRVTDTWLCRCGQSKNKPYCDGSHRAAGFRG